MGLKVRKPDVSHSQCDGIATMDCIESLLYKQKVARQELSAALGRDGFLTGLFTPLECHIRCAGFAD